MLLLLIVLAAIILLLGVCAVAAVIVGGRGERCAEPQQPERVHHLPAKRAADHPSVTASG